MAEPLKLAVVPEKRTSSQTAAALYLREAYNRPCFICKQTGACGHREARVELAIAAAIAARER